MIICLIKASCKHLNDRKAYPSTTCLKNFDDFSTTSIQTGDTLACSYRVHIGNILKASRDSVNSSLQSSISSPKNKNTLIIKYVYYFIKTAQFDIRRNFAQKQNSGQMKRTGRSHKFLCGLDYH